MKQETSHIEFDAYFPPQLNLENAKSSLDVEGPYHYNIFSESVGPSFCENLSPAHENAHLTHTLSSHQSWLANFSALQPLEGLQNCPG